MKSKEINALSAIRFKECRKKCNITQEALSEMSNYSIQQISYIENGKRPLSAEAAVIFGKIFGVTSAYLLCDSPYYTKESPDSIGAIFKEELDLNFINLIRFLGNRIIDIKIDGTAKDGEYGNSLVIIQTLFPQIGYYKLPLREFNAIKRDIFEYIQLKFNNSGHYDEPEDLHHLHLDEIQKNMAQLSNEYHFFGDDKIDEEIVNADIEKFLD